MAAIFSIRDSSDEIFNFTEYELSRKTTQGVPHDWHIFSVVAKKS